MENILHFKLKHWIFFKKLNIKIMAQACLQFAGDLKLLKKKN